jgi:hypothetical protein
MGRACSTHEEKRTVSLFQIIQSRIMGWLMNDELGSTPKEVVVT